MLGDELLREMRLAGCERLSLGVESGSQKILDAIDKKITVDEIIESTELAKKYGIKVRYYMMVGNRGETRETFDETLRFLERAKPHQYIFACLSVYPGTRDFDAAVEAGWLDGEFYFERDFQELKTTFDASDEDTRFMRDWFLRNKGLREGFREGVEDYEAILERLGDHHAAHMDLGGALLPRGPARRGRAPRAARARARVPGARASRSTTSRASRRGAGTTRAMREIFAEAMKRDPQHWVLVRNVRALREWAAAGRPGLPDLVSEHDFQLLERTAQPTLPGPLADDFAVWHPPPAAAGTSGGQLEQGRSTRGSSASSRREQAGRPQTGCVWAYVKNGAPSCARGARTSLVTASSPRLVGAKVDGCGV